MDGPARMVNGKTIDAGKIVCEVENEEATDGNGKHPLFGPTDSYAYGGGGHLVTGMLDDTAKTVMVYTNHGIILTPLIMSVVFTV